MLATINFDDQLGSMTGEVDNVMAYWNLTPEMKSREMLTQHRPKRAFGVRHIASKTTSALSGAGWRVMLHDIALR